MTVAPAEAALDFLPDEVAVFSELLAPVEAALDFFPEVVCKYF